MMGMVTGFGRWPEISQCGHRWAPRFSFLWTLSETEIFFFQTPSETAFLPPLDTEVFLLRTPSDTAFLPPLDTKVFLLWEPSETKIFSFSDTDEHRVFSLLQTPRFPLCRHHQKLRFF